MFFDSKKINLLLNFESVPPELGRSVDGKETNFESSLRKINNFKELIRINNA